MADILQNFSDLENIFADLLTTATGLASSSVLVAYTRLGKPSFDNGTDMVYIRLMQESDDRMKYKNRTSVYSTETQKFTFSQQSSRTLDLGITFYGPNCMKYAQKANEFFYFANTKLLLAQSNLFLVAERTVGPIRIPEQFNGQWWERADLNLLLYNTVLVENIVEKFNSYTIETEAE